MTTHKNTKAEALATQQHALSKHGVALIGLFGANEQLQALVRLPSGRIKQIEAGARLPIGRVIAIDTEGLLIQHGNATSRLPMIGGE